MTASTGAASPFGQAQASPFGQASSSLTWGSASPFGQGPFADSSGDGLPKVNLKPHKETTLEAADRTAFEAAAFEYYKIPEVEPPPSVC
jgi:hypothetical protein